MNFAFGANKIFTFAFLFSIFIESSFSKFFELGFLYNSS